MTTPPDVSRKAAAIAKAAADLARRMAAGLEGPPNGKLLLIAERLDAEAAELAASANDGPGNPAPVKALNEVESFASVQSMPPRYTISSRALFGDEILKILKGFDAYVRAELAKGSQPSVAGFHSLHGAELKFSEQSLLRWLDLRRRHGQRRED